VRDLTDARLLISADWQQRLPQLFLAEHAQHVALVFAAVEPAQQVHCTALITLQTGVMPGGEVFCPQGAGALQQQPPADFAVAGGTRVGCFTTRIAVKE